MASEKKSMKKCFDFRKLGKEQKLLVYMLKLGASCRSYPLQLCLHGKNAVEVGASANLKSLQVMLQTLKKKNYVLGLGRGMWFLTDFGREKARWYAGLCGLIGPHSIEEQLGLPED